MTYIKVVFVMLRRVNHISSLAGAGELSTWRQVVCQTPGATPIRGV
ncbi:MAG: hypothetical protein GY757_18735 [bacterium]|nr:hypothetical protein [bacterium]